MRECTRCAKIEPVDELGKSLVHFVCTDCRKDSRTEFSRIEEVEPEAKKRLAEVIKDLTDVNSN